MLRPKQMHFWVLGFAFLSIPFWGSLYMAHEFRGGIGQFNPIDFPRLAINALRGVDGTLFADVIRVALLGGVLVFAGLLFLFEGVITGIEGTDSHGSARWAAKHELYKAKLVEPWGVAFGKFGKPSSRGKVLKVNSELFSNMLVSAPPGSGKTAGIVIPTLLELPHGFMVYDIKGEIYEATARQRLAMGDQVKVFAPFDLELEDTDEHGHSLHKVSHGFNPLIDIAAIEDIEDRLIKIQTLATALLSPKGPSDAHLLDDGKRIFIAAASIVCADKSKSPTIADVSRLLAPLVADDGATVDYKSTFLALADRAPDPISRDNLMKAAGQDNKSLGIYMAVLQGAGLQAWDNPAIVRATQTNDLDFSRLRTVPTSFYLCIPSQHKEVTAPVVRLIMQWAIEALQERKPKRGGRAMPFLFMIDEFHSLGRMQSLVDAATLLRGFGGRLCIIVQTPASIRALYGVEASEIFMDTIQLRVWMAPNSDKTKKELADALGMKTIAKRSVSAKRIGEYGDQSHSYSETGRALMTPEELGRLDDKKLIVTMQNGYPAIVNKIRYFEDKHFAPIWKAQDKMPWPKLPVVKSKIVKTYGEFLGGIEVKTETVPAPANDHDYTYHLDSVGALLDIVPITDDDDAELKEAAANITPEKLIERTANIVDDGSLDAEKVRQLSKLIASKLAA